MRSRISHFLLCLSLIFCVGFGSNITAHAAVNDTVFLAPSSQTSLYFNSAFSNGGLLLTAKSTVTYAIPWEILVAPPLNYAEVDGDFYITFVNYRDYDPAVNFYTEDGTPLQFVTYKHIPIDSLSYDTSYFIYRVSGDLAYIQFGPQGFGSLVANQTVFFSAYFAPAGTEQSNDDIITAIQNQTSDILSKLDSQTDEITGAIEDQYSGSFGSNVLVGPLLDSVYGDNALTFGEGALQDIFSIFSPDQELSSEIVFPSMSLSIAGQRQTVQLWPEYRFDLEDLNNYFPFLITLMRTCTVSYVYWLLLRYCYHIFNKYFLYNGG